MDRLDNPYAAPRADAAEPSDYGTDAPLGARFVNLILDYLGQTLLVGDLGSVLSSTGLEHWALIVGFSVWVGYYVVFEAAFGRTPAKFVTGTQVVTTEGRHPRLLQILGRTLARLIPFEQLSFLGSPPRGWHDRLSGTRVITLRGTSSD